MSGEERVAYDLKIIVNIVYVVIALVKNYQSNIKFSQE